MSRECECVHGCLLPECIGYCQMGSLHSGATVSLPQLQRTAATCRQILPSGASLLGDRQSPVASSRNRSLLLSVTLSPLLLYPSLSNVAAPRHEPCTLHHSLIYLLLLLSVGLFQTCAFAQHRLRRCLRASTSRRDFSLCPIVRFSRHQRFAFPFLSTPPSPESAFKKFLICQSDASLHSLPSVVSNRL